MKILLVNKFYFVKGGSERYFFEMKHLLESKGHEVIPFSMRHPSNERSPYETTFVDQTEYQDTKSNTLLKQIRLAGKIIYSRHAQHQIEKLIRKTRPDVAHLHMIDHQISPSILHTLKKHRIPVVQTMHQYKLVCPNYLFYIPWRNWICTKCLDGNILHPFLERCHKHSMIASGLLVLETFLHRSLRIYRLVDRFHVPSRFMGEMLRQGGIPSVKIVHQNYCINIDDFPQSHQFENFYLFIGRLSPEKGILTLLKAASELPDYPLSLIGDGPERPSLEQFILKHGLLHIHFKGNLGKGEVIQWISRARFVVVPSEWFENSPLVIYESFAMGKPVIGADIGGISELVEHQKNGLLFPSGDVNVLRSHIQTLMADVNKCRLMGEAARQKAEGVFSGEKHYPIMMKLYQSLLDEKAGVREPVGKKE